MRIFIYEYLCAGGATKAIADSLAVEGWVMLAALLEDFRRVPGATIETMLSCGRDAEAPVGVTVHTAHNGEEKEIFTRLAAASDWTLVVAPEFDDILARLLRWVREAGGRSLNATPEAAIVTGDKLRLAGCLAERGIPTPATTCWPPPSSFPAVFKPRRGAGSQATFLIRTEDELREAVRASVDWCDDRITQPFIPGDAVSVAFLIGPSCRLAMPAGAQHLSTDGRFHYLGGSLPLDAERNERAAQLAARALDAVEGLAGYIGVDLVLGTTVAEDAVIEINPRLTTSYVGLRALARFNLAEAMLTVAQGEEPTCWDWATESVFFTVDGGIASRSS